MKSLSGTDIEKLGEGDEGGACGIGGRVVKIKPTSKELKAHRLESSSQKV